jgi:fluoride exporter
VRETPKRTRLCPHLGPRTRGEGACRRVRHRVDFLWVGVGGFAGAVARYALGLAIVERLGSSFPWHTLLINLTGSFAIGIVMVLLIDRSMLDSHLRLLLAVGFLGGYTTFSSYTFEAITLIERGAWMPSLAYLLASNLLGLLATVGGISLARALLR